MLLGLFLIFWKNKNKKRKNKYILIFFGFGSFMNIHLKKRK